MTIHLPRRRFLAGLGAAIAAAPAPAAALGRTPLGGRLAFHVPWNLRTLDPHDLRDPAAALFGPAIVDPVYALDANGYPYPTLASGLPLREAGETVVRLREGLRTARGVPLDARDLVHSIDRARGLGAQGLLAEVPRPSVRKGDVQTAAFGTVDPLYLARALSSPLCALIPRRAAPGAIDGTGAFRADLGSAGLVLTRNPNAARGPAFLEQIDVLRADDLKTSLRAFEAERDDLGWLGVGLHDVRKGAQRFDVGRAAWVVLTIGPDSGPFGAPGVAQKLVDAIPPERLAHLGLGPLPAASGDPGWGGPPADLCVDEGAPYLVEVARAVAPVLSRSGHEITIAPVARSEVGKRRAARGKPFLAIELVRPLGPSPREALIALATAEDGARGRDVARSAPRLPSGATARSLTGALRVGVIGDVRVAGGIIPDVVLARSPSGDGWDLGATYRRSARR